ncbi:MAG: hypothetical protein DRR42_27105 [Gammaproteobacteria bacterium]|nr:MAG: hypothetical protein DRR42_27105 [Gammaproteobacteria bacterium]
MSSLESELTADLEWREAELAAMKALLVRTPQLSPSRKAMLRSCTALLYAHYEGFCKFCWDAYLDAVEKDSSIFTEQLVEDLAILSVKKLLKSARGNLSDRGLWNLAHTDLPARLNIRPKFEVRPETESNLWPNLLRDNLGLIGLSSCQLEEFSTQLGSLVGKRNGIAHGERLTIKGIDEFGQFEKAALMVMHDVALTMIDSIKNRSYAIS